MLVLNTILLWQSSARILWHTIQLHAYAWMIRNNFMYYLTTLNIIIMGFFIKASESGRGFIWSENIGEAGTWGTAVLKAKVVSIIMCMVTNQHWNHSYPLVEDGSLKPLPFLITVLAIVSSSEPAANHNIVVICIRVCTYINYVLRNTMHVWTAVELTHYNYHYPTRDLWRLILCMYIGVLICLPLTAWLWTHWLNSMKRMILHNYVLIVKF